MLIFAVIPVVWFIFSLSGTFPFDDESDLIEQIRDWEKGSDIFREKKWTPVSEHGKVMSEIQYSLLLRFS